MSQSHVETCQIRLMWSRPKSLRRAMVAVSGKELCRWVAEGTTSSGTVVIAESKEFMLPFNESDPSAAWEDRATITTDAHQIRQQLFEKLQADGWELVTGDPDDRMLTLQRDRLPTPSLDDSNLAERLQQLAFLRNASIITSEEYEKQKAELLKRP